MGAATSHCHVYNHTPVTIPLFTFNNADIIYSTYFRNDFLNAGKLKFFD